MAVRIGLGISRGTPLIVGAALVAGGLVAWWTGFTVAAAVLFAVGTTTALERRRRTVTDVQGPRCV